MPGPEQTATRVRLRFAKRGDLRLISHHDLMRCLERMLRRARIPMALSQGFNPRPKVVFALAMGLGIEGLREVVDLELSGPMEPAEILRRLSAAAPPGFDWIEAGGLAPGRPPRAEAVRYALPVPDDRRAAARAAVAELLAGGPRTTTRRRPDRPDATFDLRPFVLDAELGASGLLRFRLRMTPDGSARPEEVIDALGLSDLLGQGAVLVRTDVELAPGPQVGPAPAGSLASPERIAPATIHSPLAPAAERPLTRPTLTVTGSESSPHEERNADQRAPARGMPDRHR